MKLLQKILSHGLLIALLVAAFFLYQERTELFPQWFGKSAQHASAPVKATTKAPAPVEPVPAAAETRPVATQNTDNAAAVEVEAVQEAPDAVADAVPVAAATPTQEQPAADASDAPLAVAGDSGTDTTPAVADRPAPVFRPLDDEAQTKSTPVAGGDIAAADEVAISVVAPPAVEQPEPVPDTAAVEQQPAAVAEPLAAAAPLQEPAPAPVITPPVTETTPAEAPVTPQPEVEQAAVESAQPAAPAADKTPAATADPVFQSRLEQARSLFWQRNSRAALQAYRGLTADYPDSAQAWGELGNLYFNLRQAPAAASAYARAIDLLIMQGEFMRAHQLLGVMYRLNTRQARQLEARLRQAGG